MADTASAAAWKISAGQATNLLAAPRSSIDLDNPRAGIEVWRDPTQPERVLGIDLDAGCGRIDAWCRGGDLTAVYEPTGGAPLRVTAMWRASPPWRDPHVAPAVWCREVVVSAQTPLQEAIPRIAVTADVAGGTAIPLEYRSGGLRNPEGTPARPQGFLVRCPAGTRLVFLIHPGDVQDIDTDMAAGRVRIRAPFFPAALEKGVLLRSRAVAAFGPADGDAIPPWAHALAEEFAGSPPVLTT